MKKENKYISQSLAESIDALGGLKGVESEWYWTDYTYFSEGELTTDWLLKTKKEAEKWVGLTFPAYDCAELGEWLPRMITFQETFYFFTMWKRKNGWATGYKPNEGHNYFPAQLSRNEPEARGLMAVYLIKNKLV